MVLYYLHCDKGLPGKYRSLFDGLKDHKVFGFHDEYYSFLDQPLSSLNEQDQDSEKGRHYSENNDTQGDWHPLLQNLEKYTSII